MYWKSDYTNMLNIFNVDLIAFVKYVLIRYTIEALVLLVGFIIN